MTVKELIDQLYDLDEDDEVMFVSSETGGTEDIERISSRRAGHWEKGKFIATNVVTIEGW